MSQLLWPLFKNGYSQDYIHLNGINDDNIN